MFNKILNLFKNDNETNNKLAVTNNSVQSYFNVLKVHPDITDLLWIIDGDKKNYVQQDNRQYIDVNGIKFYLPSFSSYEPSLMSVKLPIEYVENITDIERPPYYPTYLNLTNEQRGVYWKFLENPYDNKFNIGYVFILYYGLERQLLEGKFDEAFNVILKLRDVHSNGSFQSYSACALILSCIVKQRPDMAIKFYESIDKDYESVFPDELYLMCKFSLNIPINSKDIMRMSKTFSFENNNYIKKYPDLFSETLDDNLQEQIGDKEILLSNYFNKDDFRKLYNVKYPIFANTSIRDKEIEIPAISSNFKLKKVVYDLLSKTHEDVKRKLSELRKSGEVPIVKENTNKRKVIENFDVAMEQNLIERLENSTRTLDKHFILIEIQNFYYKCRNIDEVYLEKCIQYCNLDIDLLPKVQSDYIEEEKSRILMYKEIYTKEELNKEMSNITSFEGRIPAFERLAIIYEKQKKYQKAIDVCENAINYYKSISLTNYVTDFNNRMLKLIEKTAK